MTQPTKPGAAAGPKRKLKPGAKNSAGTTPSKHKPKLRPKPAWDGFTSDLNRFKLPAKELERKLADRKSKHMPDTSAMHSVQEERGLKGRYAAGDAMDESLRTIEESFGSGSGAPEPTYPLHKDPALGVSGHDHSKLASLDYRSIAKLLQAKAARKNLQVRGEVQQEGGQESPRCLEGVVNFEDEIRDFLKRRVQEQKDEKGSEPSASPSRHAWQPDYPRAEPEQSAQNCAETEGVEKGPGARGGGDSSQESDLDGDEDTHIAGGGLELTLCSPGTLARAGTGRGSKRGGNSWEQRAAAAEARLKELDGLPRKVEAMKDEMDALRSENQALSAEFTEFMGHTTTVLTKLQAQFAQLLTTSYRPPLQPSAQAEIPPVAPAPVCPPPAPLGPPPADVPAPRLEAAPGPAAAPASQYSHQAGSFLGNGSLASLPAPYRPKPSVLAPIPAPADEDAQLPSFSQISGDFGRGTASEGRPSAAWPSQRLQPAVPDYAPPARAWAAPLAAMDMSGFTGPSAQVSSATDPAALAQNSLSLSKHAAAGC